MNIAELVTKGNTWRQNLKMRIRGRIAAIPKDVLVVGVILLSSSASFGLGMLTERDIGQKSAFSIKEVPLEAVAAAEAAAEPGITIAPASLPGASGEVIASKSGTKYYYPWCSGISRISPENRVTFTSAEVAQAKGYELSSTCKNP